MTTHHFFQTDLWFAFWQNLNTQGSKIHTVTTGKISAKVRQLPWKFGKNYFYIPKGPFFEVSLNANEFKTEMQKLITKLEVLAKKEKVLFTRFEFSQEIIQLSNYNLTNLQAIDSRIKKTDTLPIITKGAILNIASLISDPINKEITDNNLLKFYQENLPFWNKRSFDCNSKTKKSLKQKWVVSTVKSQDNFNNFWKLYKQINNTERESLKSTKDYFKTLFSQSFTNIVILKGDKNLPQAAIIGAEIDNRFINLYSVYTTKALNSQANNLITLVSLYKATQNGMKTYDFGDFNLLSSNSNFIESYNPHIIDYGSVYELKFHPFQYKITKFLSSPLSVIKR